MTHSIGPVIGEQKGKDFLKYFVKNYFDGEFPVVMWNHFDTVGDRTNNRVEGDNTKMKSYCGAADPKIHKACHLLRLYESTAFDKYYNAKKPNSKQARVRLEDRLKEERFKEMKALLSNGDIEFEVYFRRIIEIFEFVPKKKYSEELVETDFSESDEHDAEISSDDNDDSLPNLFGEISIDNREEESTMNRTHFNRALRDEMASSQVINCPNNCGKQFSKRGMKNHLNNCK